MDAIDPISPELVLVSPELRTRALAGLTDTEFAAHVDDIRRREKDAFEEPREPPPSVRRLLRVPVAAWIVISALTLALTIAADQLR